MGLNNFRLNVLLRVGLLLALVFVLVWGLLNTEWQVTPLVSALLIFLCLFDLVHYVEKSNREFTSFLEFIHHHDFSVEIANRGKGKVFTELGSAYKLITSEFQQLHLEKEAHYRYLESVIEHISVALICLDEDGAVVLMNQQAKKLFKAPYLPGSRSFNRIDKNLPEILQRLADGERHLISIRIEDENLQLVLYATEFQLLDHRYKLVSFQNIRDELEQREIDSWQKLIRVLTHEIMNSVTPIISLTSIIRETLLPGGDDNLVVGELSAGDKDDLLRSIRSIESRSKGLLNFVQSYSSLTNIPTPEFSMINVAGLLHQVRTIMHPAMEKSGIGLEVDCEIKDLTIRADPQLIEQVLINLIKNAFEALTNQPGPKIRLRGFISRHGKVLLQVIDNGPGIDQADLDKIFIPFFTTKRDGSGIGLSISRQILYAHKGLLSVKTAPGKGCIFTLRFN